MKARAKRGGWYLTSILLIGNYVLTDNNSKFERYYGLDLARALFMILGVFYHSALIFNIEPWRVGAAYSNKIIETMASVSNDFRMEAFYLLSGFFFMLIYEKYGYKKAIVDRVIKLGLPLLIVGFTFNTLMNYLSINQTVIFNFNYIYTGQWLAHLWFIANLLIYCLLLTPCIPFLLNNQLLAKVKVPYLIFGFFIVIPIVSALLFKIGQVYLNYVLFISNIPALLEYMPYFISGLLFWKYRKDLIPFLTLKIAVYLIVFYLISKQLKIIQDIYDWNVGFILSQFGAGCLGVGIIAFCQQIGKPSGLLQKIVESSYSVYLLHMPIIVFIFSLFTFITNDWLLLISIVTATYILCHFFHYYIIKKNRYFDLFFNGNYKFLTKN